jgi:chromosome condensin MukBEF ATPase and DNA-binding subunit MukB
MHKISDNRMTGSMVKNLRIFTSLCGQKAMPNVIIATTMWDKVDKEEGIQREQELKDELWKDILAQGCRCKRFENTYESAWHIVSDLVDVEKDRAPVLLPREIVDTHLRLNETKAGIVLNRELEALMKEREQKARSIRQLAKQQLKELVIQELNELTAEIDDKIRNIADQLRQMKIPFTRRIYLFFKVKNS